MRFLTLFTPVDKCLEWRETLLAAALSTSATGMNNEGLTWFLLLEDSYPEPTEPFSDT